jgi:hypothetical protein
VEALRVGTPETATLSYDGSLGDVNVRAEEQLDEAAREDFAVAGSIEDAVVVFACGQRRGLR